MFKNQKGVISTLIVAGALIFLTASTIITSLLVKNRLSLNPKAVVNTDTCVNGIVTNDFKLFRADGVTEIRNNEVINDVSGIKCQVHVQGVSQADKFLVCAIWKNDIWPVECPKATGDYSQIVHTWDTNITTTFNKCDRNLLSPPAGHPSLSAGMALKFVAARFTTGDERQCSWNIPTPTALPQYVAGPIVYYLEKPADTPIPPTPIPACSGNSCTDCILRETPTGVTILPFYQANGWDISCSNQTNIVNNWCANSADCARIKNNACASYCVAATAIPTLTPVPTTPIPTTPVGGNSRIFINRPGPNGDIIMTVFAVRDCSTSIVTKIDGNPNTCQPIPGSPGDLGYTCGTWDTGNPIAKYGLDRNTYPCWWQLKCNPVSPDPSITHRAEFSTTDPDRGEWCGSSSTQFTVNSSKQDIKQPTCTGAIVKKNGIQVYSVRKGETITVQAQNVANATRIRFAMTRADSPTCRVNRDTGRIEANFYDIGSNLGLVDGISFPTPRNVSSNPFQIPLTATEGDYYVFANPAAIYSYRVRGSNNPPYSWVYTSNPAADNSADPYVNQFWCTNNGANDGSKCNGNYCDDVAMADKVPLISRNNVNGQPDCVTVLTITN